MHRSKRWRGRQTGTFANRQKIANTGLKTNVAVPDAAGRVLLTCAHLNFEQAAVLAGVLARWRTSVCAATLSVYVNKPGLLPKVSPMFCLLSGRTLSFFPDNSEVRVEFRVPVDVMPLSVEPPVLVCFAWLVA